MPLSHRDYTVACICPMGVELAPVKALLDQTHPSLPTQRDQNSYTLGVIGGHNTVIAVLPEIGTNSAATVATQLLNDFPSIRFGLLVGIGGGVPDLANEIDIRLGDIVVSKPTKTAGGVVQYDMGKETLNGFERTGTLDKPPAILQTAVQQLVAQHELEDSHVPLYLSKMVEKFSKMKEKYTHPGAGHDQLFETAYEHQGGKTCASCDSSQVVRRPPRSSSSPFIHYGTIGSANRVIKNAAQREKLKSGDLDIMCVEMEAAGLMDSFPCLVIRGICDYADSHKNKKWQPYAAATAAAYMKEILSVIPAQEVTKIPDATSVVQIPQDDKGLNLFDAPDMGEGLFIGREAEFQDMESILQPQSDSPDSTRKVLILGGMGGIGKTQLAITYAKRHRHSYSSIFWLNANTEATLNNSLRAVANRILPPETFSMLDDDQVRIHVSNWLSKLDNTRWLLIFDNHDDPDQYKITKYYPSVAHGSIIITTRQPDRVNGEKIKVQSMAKEEESLRILATRSGRDNVISDSDARALAERLDGHPLALATAGAFLSQSSLSFTKYLQRYEATWKVIDSVKELSDYPSRTLYTTWDLSFMQIKQQNVRAANLLRFLAYLDHQDIWYEFLHGGQGGDQPPWFTELVSDESVFEDAMQTLTRYCLVESHHQTGSYSLHACVHDWTLTGLNAQIDTTQYWLAFNCLASHIGLDDWDNFSVLRYRRFVPHAVRLAHERFQKVGSQQEWLQHKLTETCATARLLDEQVQYEAAERMYVRALAGKERALGPDHTSTLDTINYLGNLYRAQGKLAEAEQMYVRALAGSERALGPDHKSTLDTVNGLGNLYFDQDKLAEAEQMYVQALAGREMVLGPDHTLTLNTVHNLGDLYRAQGKLAEAEQMYVRALAGKEMVLGPDHTSTLMTVNSLGLLYRAQGKLAEAEQMYVRALAGKEKAVGPDHTSTLDTVDNLGNLYQAQGKLAEAEQMHQRALAGSERALGPDHTSTLDTVDNLGSLYRVQGKLAEAEQMHVRALAGSERALGPDHASTLATVHNLGNLYFEQSKLAEAERMYVRALARKEKALGPDHTSTLDTVNNLGCLYRAQGKLVEAAQMYVRALAGSERALGPDHMSTLNTVNNLGILYQAQGKLAEAEQMYVRALAGSERALGPDHTSTLITVNGLGVLYSNQGKLAEAEQMYVRALAGYEKTSLSHTIAALKAIRNLGVLYRDQARMEQAKEMFQRAVLGREKVLGPHHPHTLEVVDDLRQLDVEATENEGQNTDVSHNPSTKRTRQKNLPRL